MVGRDAFMQNIANRLGRKNPLQTPPARDVIGVPEHYAAIRHTQEELIELFVQNWTALSGKALIVERDSAAMAIRAYLSEICRELDVRQVTRWTHDELEALGLDEHLRAEGIRVVPWEEDGGEDMRVLAEEAANRPAEDGPGGNWRERSPLLKAAEQCELGIIWPDYAVANTSTLIQLSRGGQGRSVSLLTRILFAVFRADQLVTRMGEAFADIRRRFPETADLPSSINLITGPSRSADIENDLTIGVHGPGQVYAVIIQ
jgi:L-lactate utilization protein LutC